MSHSGAERGKALSLMSPTDGRSVERGWLVILRLRRRGRARLSRVETQARHIG
jgi:hypothetical protein